MWKIWCASFNLKFRILTKTLKVLKSFRQSFYVPANFWINQSFNIYTHTQTSCEVAVLWETLFPTLFLLFLAVLCFSWWPVEFVRARQNCKKKKIITLIENVSKTGMKMMNLQVFIKVLKHENLAKAKTFRILTNFAN